MEQNVKSSTRGETPRRHLEEKIWLNEERIQQRLDRAPFGPKTKELLEDYARYESSGGMGWAIFDNTPVIVRGEGSFLYDADGKEYLDFLSGFSVSNLGNQHPEICRIIKEQTDTLTHFFDFPHLQRVRMAKKLCQLSRISAPTRVVFGVTGSDSVELAVRVARYFTGQPYILTAYGDYHGVTYGTMGLTSKGGMHPYFYPVRPNADVGYFQMPHAYRNAQDSYPGPGLEALDQLRGLLKGKESVFGDGTFGVSNVAAILVEPFQSSAGYYVPPPEYLRGLREICDEFGLLLIVDEIQAGLGRSGMLWAFEHSGIEPDLFCTSKALGGGVPLSAVVGRSDILSSWGPGAHVSTQAGNALACAAGNYVLDTVSDPDFLAQVQQKGRYFKEGLQDIQRRRPLLSWIDNCGLYTGIELVRDRAKKTPAVEATTFVRDRCVEKGMLFEKGGYYHNRIQLIPALNIGEDILDRALKVLDEVLKEAEDYS